MKRTEFWKLVLTSSLLSTAMVVFLIRWPVPEPAHAGFTNTRTQTFGTGRTQDEDINIRIYDELGPGVVNVTSTTLERNFWFDVIPRRGVGSGVVIDREGRIVTNFHVVQEASRIEVTLYDKSSYEAKVLGTDRFNDLAILEIDCPAEKLHPIELGSSDNLKVGQKVLAIGNPFGFEHTLTTGIISSLGRSLRTDSGVIENVIQSDAAINPGNSGGPLLNTQGELIGINTAIYSRSGESAGIGFAVPVNILRRIVPDLVSLGYVRRPWFGVQGRALTPGLASALKLPVQEGLLIERVEQGSSSDLAGLRGGRRRVLLGNFFLIIGGDILVSLDGQPVRSHDDLVRLLADKRPGDRVGAGFYRGDRRIETVIELVGYERFGARRI
ncbi:MAG: trypsin-like peptidase domain-containing protein [Candidatus Aminicenantes bacterium]|nr:trypsin-like peptidase domain-containing protein [Candidatus Aminicenantes bacterium]